MTQKSLKTQKSLNSAFKRRGKIFIMFKSKGKNEIQNTKRHRGVPAAVGSKPRVVVGAGCVVPIYQLVSFVTDRQTQTGRQTDRHTDRHENLLHCAHLSAVFLSTHIHTI
jgi:hypothetical protein